MKEPKTVFLIFSTGKIVCTGTKDKEDVHNAVIKLNKEVRDLDIARDQMGGGEYQDITFI
jgi:TATA-box binding protein (TBP) (component of TFIID and TFIIIB)